MLIPVLMAGCDTLTHQDRAILREHGVSADVYDQMLYGDPLSLDDVIALSKRSVPAGLIIHYMDETEIAYRLRKADVTRLREAGVNEEVISHMLSTACYYGPGVSVGSAYPYSYPYPYGYPDEYYDYGYPFLGAGFYDYGYGYGGWGGGRWGHGGGWGRGGRGGGGWGHGGGGHGGGGHGR